GGTGIGLALVKQLVELMGGSIAVESRPRHGSCFQLRLPRRAGPSAAQAEPGSPATVADADSRLLRRARFEENRASDLAPVSNPDQRPNAPRVLVADDNPDLRHYIAELLRGDYRVLCAADGLEAWELLQHQPVDVVLADVMMPTLDGLGLTTRIKASDHLAHLPVILLTARGGKQARIAGLQCGADDYIAKPFFPDELLARLQAALRMGRIQHQLRERAHDAGMALLATGILHNLGNVLNGITVTAAVIRDQLQQSKLGAVAKLAELLEAHRDDLPSFFARDAQGQALPAFIAQLAEQLAAEQRGLFREVEVLRHCATHADSVIACQRNLAKPGREILAPMTAHGLLEAALELATAAFALRDIEIERDYAYDGAVLTDRHKALQILLNLLSNASQALATWPADGKRIQLRVTCDADTVCLEVRDNGQGIAAERLPGLFDQGASSRGDGHGYGLHLSASWAHELGGRLSGQSDGPGRGARFILELPAPPAQSSRARTLPAAQGVED
ncbi:MAG: ATP-binding protein, partial [Pseudomonas sp.]